MRQILNQVANDWQLQTLILLVVADFLFGVLAALKTKTFDLGRIADTLKEDVLFKVAPYGLLAAIAVVANNEVGSVPELSWDVLAAGAFAVGVGALVKSLADSLRELDLPIPNIEVQRKSK